jgi:hypothetical protein
MLIAIVIILILMSATFSGLTIGMFSLGLGDLERKINKFNRQARNKILDVALGKLNRHGNPAKTYKGFIWKIKK